MAIQHEQEVAHLDQALDLERCLKSTMNARTGRDGIEISGRVTTNFPGYSMPETCRAILRSGRVDAATIQCR